MKVEVVRSARRRKTVQARQVGGVLRVSIPANMTAADEERWVAEMVRRMERRAATDGVDLVARAEALADRYDLPRPAAIRWVDNQEWRWGSCTPSDGTVRISSRLVGEPSWVLDYVIVHELAHLRVPHHNDRFWALVRRYPRAERAYGFLLARGLDPTLGDEPAERGSPPQPVEGRTAGRQAEHQPDRRPGPTTRREATRREAARRETAGREAASETRRRRTRQSSADANSPRLPGF
ncbi:MAG TPA: YgjP-like metallopeptidase domain-containing protein [Acidimicrobiales bacterium]